MSNSGNPMIYLNKSDFPLVHDLNRFPDLGHARRISSAGDWHALGSTRLCASHDLSALEGIQSHGQTQARSAQSQRLLLSRSILGPVFCSVDRPRIFARHRDQFECAAPTFLSLGFSLQDDLAQHLVQRQPSSTMGSLLPIWRIIRSAWLVRFTPTTQRAPISNR